MRVMVITSGFPYGDSEYPFFYTEFLELCRHFEIVLCPINPATNDIQHAIPQEVAVIPIYIRQRKQKRFIALFELWRDSFMAEIKYALKPGDEYIGFNKAVTRIKKVLSYYLDSFVYYDLINQIIENNKIDVIYTYWCTHATFAAVRYKKKNSRIKVVTRFHGYDLYNDRVSYGYQCFRQEIAEVSDRLFFVSNAGKDYFAQHWNVLFSKTRVAYLGSDDFGFTPLKQGRNCDKIKLVMVSCSSVIPLKRIELIVQGLGMISDSDIISWVHFGDGEEMDYIRGLCAEVLDQKTNITWELKGNINNSILADEYRRIGASLFITTSSTEGMPVSMMEAMSMGIPVIATKVGGIPEAIHDGVNGYLLGNNPNPIEVAGAIHSYYVLSDEDKRQMSVQIRAKWENTFDARKNAKCFAQEMVNMCTNNYGE